MKPYSLVPGTIELLIGLDDVVGLDTDEIDGAVLEDVIKGVEGNTSKDDLVGKQIASSERGTGNRPEAEGRIGKPAGQVVCR